MKPQIYTNGNIKYPYLSVKPCFSVIYFKSDSKPVRSEKVVNQFNEMSKKQKLTGIISKKTSTKIQNSINWLLIFSEYKKIKIGSKLVNSKMTFLTLTLPSKQIHTDNFIKANCLNHFIIELTKMFPNLLYVWRAEKQANENIHFHFATNIVLHYSILQDIWNRIIDKYNYVKQYTINQKNKYKDGFYFDLKTFEKYGTTKEKQFDRYKKALSEGFCKPHSTEIKDIRNINDMAAYLSKYMAKSEKESKNLVSGRIWACSRFISQLKITIDLLDYDFEYKDFCYIKHDFFILILTKLDDLLKTKISDELSSNIEFYKDSLNNMTNNKPTKKEKNKPQIIDTTEIKPIEHQVNITTTEPFLYNLLKPF